MYKQSRVLRIMGQEAGVNLRIQKIENGARGWYKFENPKNGEREGLRIAWLEKIKNWTGRGCCNLLYWIWETKKWWNREGLSENYVDSLSIEKDCNFDGWREVDV